MIRGLIQKKTKLICRMKKQHHVRRARAYSMKQTPTVMSVPLYIPRTSASTSVSVGQKRKRDPETMSTDTSNQPNSDPTKTPGYLPQPDSKRRRLQ